jgi:hypothetical protein
MSPSRTSHVSRRFPRETFIESLEERRLMSTTWGQQETLTGKDLAAVNYPGLTGAGTSIAILDTGVDYNHPAMGGGWGKKVVAGYDYVDNDTDPMDNNGHGTGVASVAAGLPFVYGGKTYQGAAPGADVIAFRVDSGNYGWAKWAPLAEKALQWIIANAEQYNIVAVNMSFGRGHFDTDDVIDAQLSDEFATLKGMGVVLVTSSGNDGLTQLDGIEYPGSDASVYSIGAAYPDGTIWEKTERGQYMDLLAPGANIVIPYYDVATKGHVYISGAYGTSFAAPWAAGMAAVLKQLDPSLTAAQTMSIMKDSGVTRGDSTGAWKLINFNNALSLAYARQDDAAENNDSAAAARALAFGGGTASLGDLKLLQGDADWFKFTLNTAADVDWALTLNFPGAAPAVDLIDAGGTVLKRLSASDQVGLAAGTYFVRVNAPAASLGGSYAIAVRQTPDDGGNNHTPETATPIVLNSAGQGSVANMLLLGGVSDYYSFTLDGTRDVGLAVAYAGASAMPGAQLLDTNGNVVASFAADGTLARRLGAGRYLIRVSSATTLEGSYGVNVAAAALVVPGANGSSNGIAYDSAGRLHLAYYDELAKNLKYAVRGTDGLWSSITVVDGGLMAGQFVSLQLDSLGRAGIAYYDANQADLKYAHFNGSSWDVQTVDAQFTTGYYPSLQYGGTGDVPVISYYSKTSGDLRLAAWGGSAWVISTIDSAGDVGRYSSLAYNPASGRWAVAYEDTGHGTFKYAEQGKSGWAVTTADGTTKIGGGYISLAFNPKTKLPAMSYYDAYNADLKFATFNGSRWSSQVVAGKGTVGLYSNLRIDATTGLADILYYNKGTDIVLRASQASSGAWGLTQVTTDGGRWISRAVAIDGEETLAYLSSGEVAVVDL